MIGSEREESERAALGTGQLLLAAPREWEKLSVGPCGSDIAAGGGLEGLVRLLVDWLEVFFVGLLLLIILVWFFFILFCLFAF